MDRFGLTKNVLGWISSIEMERTIWPLRPILNPTTSLLGTFHVEHGGTHFVYSVSFGVTRASMCRFAKSVVASQTKCMFWLLKALENDLFPGRIWNVLFVIRNWCLSSYGKHLGTVCSKMTRYTGKSTTHKTAHATLYIDITVEIFI